MMTESSEHPLVVIIGPTAVGKSGIAVRLADQLDGEIVSADSRQVYHHMSIGTAKPSADEMAAVPHHLVDFLDPDQRLNLADYQRMAYQAIDEIHRRGRVPFLVGGTGQYVRAVVEGWGIPEVAPHPALRADLGTFADVYGPTTLHHWLNRVDPPAAASIDYRNVRRVVRALEVYLVSGIPISVHQEKSPPPYHILQMGLARPREALYRRADQRVDAMMDAGLLEEVQALLDAGYGWDLSAMSSLGYRQFADYFAGTADLASVVEKIKTETHRFIRHQMTWFRLDDPGIHWFDLEETSSADVLSFVRSWLHHR